MIACAVETAEDKSAKGVRAALLHRFDPARYGNENPGEYRGLSLLELSRAHLAAQGIETRGLDKMELARQAMIPYRRQQGMRDGGGMLATSDLPYVLSSVADRVLRDAYAAAPQTWRPLVRIVTATDFKPMDRIAVGGNLALQEIPEGGSYPHGNLSDAKETYKIKTYGRTITISRQAIINDDLEALTRIPQLFGIASANTVAEIVWGQITGNPTMGDGKPLFHASRRNLAGTGAALDLATIAAARLAMRTQKDPDGNLINVVPTFLVVPAALETTAEKLISADYLPARFEDSAPEFIRTLKPIADPRLDDKSVTAWYLAADPATIDTVEVAFLDGQQAVRVETDLSFDHDGMRMKARLDVGAKAIEPRAFFKNPGA